MEILPNNTPTLDETLETFSFALISNNDPLPYAPMQEVKIDFSNDNTDVIEFYLVSDSVETFSLKPLRYKHSITCIQNTRKLSKHLVRNSVFTQPGYISKGSYNAISAQIWGVESGDPIRWEQDNIPSLNWASEPLVLDNHEKVKNPYLKITFQYSRNEGTSQQDYIQPEAHTVQDILYRCPLVDTLTFNDTFTLRYKNASNVTQTETINAATFGIAKLDLNATYPFPRIKELADQGCNNFEILFSSMEVLSGTWLDPDPHDPPPNLYNLDYYQLQIQIVAEVYHYNCYDVLDLLIKRQKKETSIRYDLPLFALPQSGDLYNLLKNTPAPNFTFTQLTMYECVAEVFRIFDAIFTMDENGVLGIEYFNDLDTTEIKVNKFTGRTLALGEDKYTNGLVAHYQDARIIEAFPRKDGEFANLRSAEFGVPESQDHNFIVPHNIDIIVKCEVYGEFTINNGAVKQNNPIAIDITRFVVEQTIWSTLDKGTISQTDINNRTVKQANSVYYAQGDNKIQVAATFKSSWGITKYNLYEAVSTALLRMAGTESGQEPTEIFKGDWKNIKMRLVYIASVDGKVKTHSLTNKYDGETLIDQNNGAVDLNKMGLNMLGLSLKLGNPTLNATQKITKWADRIKTGQIYQYQGKLWVANVVNYTFLNGLIQGKVSFVQNFNALALRTQLLREKRMSNISKELTQKSEEVLTDFIYYSTKASDFYSDASISGNALHFQHEFLSFFIRASFDVDLTGIYYNNIKIGDAFIHFNQVDANQQLYMIYVPMVKYGAGNTINFEMSFDHPMNAGNKTTYESSWWIGSSKYFTTHVLYTDKNGFMDQVNIRFPQSTDQYDQNFPIVTMNVNGHTNSSDFLNITNYKVYKQPNEIFALNYQLAFLPYLNREQIDFLGSEFINNNAFVKDIERGKVNRYICFLGNKSSVLDTKVSSYLVKKPLTSVQNSIAYGRTDKFSIILNFDSLTASEKNAGTFKSWAIVDDNSNILFASNSETDLNATSKTIYFITKLHRFN